VQAFSPVLVTPEISKAFSYTKEVTRIFSLSGLVYKEEFLSAPKTGSFALNK
jgi:hypothetical protein